MPLIYNLDMVLTMQGLLSSETHKADEAKQAYHSALVQNEELSKKLEDAGRKIDQLQDSVQRFVFICKFEIYDAFVSPCETRLLLQPFFLIYLFIQNISPYIVFLDDGNFSLLYSRNLRYISFTLVRLWI